MNLLGKPVYQLVDLIKEKKISSKDLFDFFKKRIKKYNHQVNAYLTEGEIEGFLKDSPLAGIPLAVKDNFCTRGLRTTAASKVLENFIPPYDATVVDRLKKNGALILGKTNMDAWAHGSSTETSAYGPTQNPHNLERSPGGSSGGSAAAVAAYLAPASIGSETAGSIRIPAAWCGLVGLKPTYGRVSRYGLIAMGSSLDCPGPITTNVRDAALILGVLAGKDPYDATSADKPVDDYQKEMMMEKKFKIGVLTDYFQGLDSSVAKAIDRAIKVFSKLGHQLTSVRSIDPKYAISVYTIIQRAEVSSNLARFDGIRYGHGRNYFGEEAKRRIMLGTYTLSYGYYDAYYKRAEDVRQLINDDFERMFKKVDLLIGPVAPITAIKLGKFKDYPFFGEMMDVFNEPSAMAGLPAITLPCGKDKNNLPIGFQIIGRQFDEANLLNIGYQFEKETDFFGTVKIPSAFNQND